MKKPYDYKEVSDKVCKKKGCSKKLKKNLLAKKPDADLCFGHHMELVRNNPRYKDGKKRPNPKSKPQRQRERV